MPAFADNSFHVCNRGVSPLQPSIPRRILKHLQQYQDQWHRRCFPTQCNRGDGISCICIERLGHRFGDAQASRLAQALSLLPSIEYLKALQLCRNSLGQHGLESLISCFVRSPNLQLRCLALCHNPIGTISLSLKQQILICCR